MERGEVERYATRPILIFVGIAYGLAIALSLVVGLTGGYRSRLIGLGYLAMFIPAAAVLLTRLVTGGEAVPVRWDRFPIRYLPLALFLMPAVMHLVMLPAAAFTGGLQWKEWPTPGRIAVNAAVGLIAVSFLALFEEVGWRAWLLPRLADHMGARRAIVVSSAIWACWHIPYALSGVQHAEGVPAAALAGVVPIGIAGAGLIIGWLWVRTESIWIVSLAHGALNNWGQYAFKFTTGPGQLRDVVILGAGGVALLAVGALLLRPARSRLLL